MIAAWVAALAGASPLTVDAVLQAVDERVPELIAAEAKLTEAEGKLQASRGAFDPVVSATLGQWTGPDPGTEASLSIDAESVWGPSASLGWAREVGEPDEVVASGVIPLLDGLGVSPARADLWVARAGVALAEADQADKRVSVRRKAAESYWRWVATGEKLVIERDLLRQVEARTAALRRQVEEGVRPRLDLLDNQRAVLQRRDATARAEQDLAVAAISLSLWYRDAAGRPVVPPPEDRPPLDTDDAQLPTVADDLAQVDARPDIRAIDALVEVARVDRSRARNGVLPTLDVVAQARQTLGSDDPTSLYAGASLTLPTLSRKGRGAVAGATAAIDGLLATRRSALDAARADVQAARVAIDASWRRVQWTREAESLAAEVVALERRRFELGGGDLFQLLARESNLAAAQKAAVDAALDHELAIVRRRAGLGR